MSELAVGTGKEFEREPERGVTATTTAALAAQLDFRDAFKIELKAVAFRRANRLKRPEETATAATTVDPAASPPSRGPSATLARIDDVQRARVAGYGDTADMAVWRMGQDNDVQRQTYQPGDPLKDADALNLTGMCLSGGGIRSAAVCMGALQALDALSPDGRSDVIDRLDYLSTVSGGNYIGTALAAGMMQQGGSFPFESKTDDAETLETQHIRDHSSFLAPNGFVDYPANVFVIIRGLIANVVMILPVLLLLAVVTILINPAQENLPNRDVFGLFESFLDKWPEWLGHLILAPMLAGGLVLFMIGWTAFKKWARNGSAISLVKRERAGRILAWMLLLVGLIAFIEWQPAILERMFAAEETRKTALAEKQAATARARQPVSQSETVRIDETVRLSQTPAEAGPGSVTARQVQRTTERVRPPEAAPPPAPPSAPSDPITGGLTAVFGWLGQAGYVLGPAIIAFVAVGQKLAKVAMATLGDASWAGIAKRLTSKLLLFVLGISVPLFLWATYLNLTFWGIRLTGDGFSAPAWIVATGAQAASILDGVTFGWLAACWQRIGPVASFYLLLALVLGLIALSFGPNANSLHQLYRDRLSRAFLMERARLRPGRRHRSDTVDRWPFSSLKPMTGGTMALEASFAPYLLVNTAINLQAEYLAQRGRNADVFTLGPLTCGSDATDYAETLDLEKRDPRLTLATGMAISGAAASANMGGNTVPVLTFSLAALNIRLGYWLTNPRRLAQIPVSDREKGVGPWWFARELFSQISDKNDRVHLTDGGHIENLGLYELLKRRCRVIVAVDAEADSGMVFSSFVKAQLLTRIDHGVRIELPWHRITQAARAAGEKLGGPDVAALRDCSGPHVAVGRIVYRQGGATTPAVHGVLIYIKSSLSGDENDAIRDYKRRFKDFPHETTLDQFFSEEQFEVYRALGFHMTHGFFTGRHEAAFWDPGDDDQRAIFMEDVKNALLSLAVEEKQVDAILARAKALQAKEAAAKRAPPPARVVVKSKTARLLERLLG